jgi:hypothetical protein
MNNIADAEVLDQYAVTGLAGIYSYFHVGILLGLFGHEYEGNMFPRNVG